MKEFQMNMLQINSSARSQGSHSTTIANELSARLLSTHTSAKLTVRDLAVTPQPTLDEAALQVLFTPAEQRTSDQAARVAIDDAVIAEIQAADVVVIGAPMYNFGVSAQLKNWMDAIARAQVTFKYTSQGPEGLLNGKKVYVVLTRGGVYRNTPTDSQVPFMTTFFGFLGMTDVEFIYAEGLAMGPEGEQRGIQAAREQIDTVLA
jgi:FMN-dependent NADH-azoreductase